LKITKRFGNQSYKYIETLKTLSPKHQLTIILDRKEAIIDFSL